MFTGIIEELAQIKNIEDQRNFLEIEILSNLSDRVNIGDSIAVNGVCLTVISSSQKSFRVDVVKETIAKTNLNNIKESMYVNLERAVRVSSRLNGHIVQGHVESLATILMKKKSDKQIDLIVKIDKEYLKYCIYKGSIAINGVSLTIAKVFSNSFLIVVIPHTLKLTNLKNIKKNDIVNIEIDIIAKYIKNLNK